MKAGTIQWCIDFLKHFFFTALYLTGSCLRLYRPIPSTRNTKSNRMLHKAINNTRSLHALDAFWSKQTASMNQSQFLFIDGLVLDWSVNDSMYSTFTTLKWSDKIYWKSSLLAYQMQEGIRWVTMDWWCVRLGTWIQVRSQLRFCGPDELSSSCHKQINWGQGMAPLNPSYKLDQAWMSSITRFWSNLFHVDTTCMLWKEIFIFLLARAKNFVKGACQRLASIRL